MLNSFIDKVKDLSHQNEPYATAYIVRRTKPSSGKPGDKAIITNDGHIHGWIGGGCTRGIVLKEALLSIKDRKARFVSIAPTPKAGALGNTINYTMTCQSGGEVEVYIEPILPKPQLVIFGVSHIAIALAKVAKAVDYRVTCCMNTPDQHVFENADELLATKEVRPDDFSNAPYVVVCTQGDGDAEALQKALAIDTPYLAFVASRKKANSIFGDLRKMGATFDQLKTIKTPAGLDINAKTPPEVAISILAEVIQHYRTEKPSENGTSSNGKLVLQNDDFFLNPVCNIPVQKSSAKHVVEYKGEKFYFCCDGCKVTFEKTPEQYATVVG